MAKQKKETLTISLTKDERAKAAELSADALGSENISGYYSYLINREYKLLKA